jgi:hypothetical protein
MVADAASVLPFLGPKPAQNLALDLSVPESPAFVVLGITPDKVVRPTSPRQLAAALLNGVDDQGNLQTGIAIDTTPYLLFKGDGLTLAQYRADRLERLLARFQVSLASTKGTSSDDEAIRLALGFRETLWDAGDVRQNDSLAACIGRVHDRLMLLTRQLSGEDISELMDRLNVTAVEVLPKLRGMNNEDILEALRRPGSDDTVTLALYEKVKRIKDDDGEADVEKCFDDAKKDNWNAAAWEIGGAPSWVSATGDFGDLESSGATFWTSLAVNLPDRDWWGLSPEEASPPDCQEPRGASEFVRCHFQLILHARYRVDQQVVDQSMPDVTFRQDDLLLGGRLRAGVPWFAISGEAAYMYEDPKGQKSSDSGRYAITAEVKLTDSVWLQISAGSDTGGADSKSEGFVLGSLRYGLSTESPYEVTRAIQ